MSNYRKIEIWGVWFFVIKETDLAILVAARMSLIPIGVEARRAGNGWGVVWLELPASFDQAEHPNDGYEPDIGSLGGEGIAPDEDG